MQQIGDQQLARLNNVTVRAHCDYTFIVLVGNDSVFEMRDVIHRYLKEHEIKLKGLERNSCIGAINDRRSLEFDSEDWWTERLSAKTTRVLRICGHAEQ